MFDGNFWNLGTFIGGYTVYIYIFQFQVYQLPSRSLETCNYLSLIWWFDFVTHVTPDIQEKWKKQREESLAELEKEDPKSDLSKVKPFSPHPRESIVKFSDDDYIGCPITSAAWGIFVRWNHSKFRWARIPGPKNGDQNDQLGIPPKWWWKVEEFPCKMPKKVRFSAQILRHGKFQLWFKSINPDFWEISLWIQLGDFIFLGDETNWFLWYIYIYVCVYI